MPDAGGESQTRHGNTSPVFEFEKIESSHSDLHQWRMSSDGPYLRQGVPEGRY